MLANWLHATLLHEVLHIAWFVSGLALIDLKRVADSEEYVIRVLTPMLADNPGLVDCLRDPDQPDPVPQG